MQRRTHWESVGAVFYFIVGYTGLLLWSLCGFWFLASTSSWFRIYGSDNSIHIAFCREAPTATILGLGLPVTFAFWTTMLFRLRRRGAATPSELVVKPLGISIALCGVAILGIYYVILSARPPRPPEVYSEADRILFESCLWLSPLAVVIATTGAFASVSIAKETFSMIFLVIPLAYSYFLLQAAFNYKNHIVDESLLWPGCFPQPLKAGLWLGGLFALWRAVQFLAARSGLESTRWKSAVVLGVWTHLLVMFWNAGLAFVAVPMIGIVPAESAKEVIRAARTWALGSLAALNLLMLAATTFIVRKRRSDAVICND